MLPQPSRTARSLSKQLSLLIDEEIRKAAGSISFERYMQLALYTPGLGYYSGPLEKFGEQGDFVTAPGIGSLFGRCLARSIAPALQSITGADIVEFGAGDGRLAATVLEELQYLETLPGRYLIIEASADLRQRQKDQLGHLPPQILARVKWLDTLPESIRGVVLGNELLDAMPCKRFQVDRNGALWELNVRSKDGTRELPQFEYVLADRPLEAKYLPTGFKPANGYESELPLQNRAWIRSLGERVREGVIILADYGFPAGEFYHPDRSQGTLMCHYRHHSHSDPFWFPGLQDITSHVDFTALAEAAAEVGLELNGYIDQANFLIDSGLADILAASQQVHPPGSREAVELAAEVKKLTMPHEMGELFKVIAFSRNLAQQPCGFNRSNRAARLLAR